MLLVKGKSDICCFDTCGGLKYICDMSSCTFGMIDCWCSGQCINLVSQGGDSCMSDGCDP